MKLVSTGATAEGFIAIGNMARGTIAIGNVAVGVIAIGNVAVGVVSIGLAASVGVVTASVNAAGLFAFGVNTVGVVSIAAVNGAGGIGLVGVNSMLSPWIGAALSAGAGAAWVLFVALPWVLNRTGVRSLRALVGGTVLQATAPVRLVDRGADELLSFVDRSGVLVRATLAPEVMRHLPRSGIGADFVVATFVATRPRGEPSGGYRDFQSGPTFRCVALEAAGGPFFPPRTGAAVRRLLFSVWPLAAAFGLALSLAIPLATPYAPRLFAALGLPVPEALGGEPPGKVGE